MGCRSCKHAKVPSTYTNQPLSLLLRPGDTNIVLAISTKRTKWIVWLYQQATCLCVYDNGIWLVFMAVATIKIRFATQKKRLQSGITQSLQTLDCAYDAYIRYVLLLAQEQ